MLKGSRDLKTKFTGLRNHVFKQQKENQRVITEKNKEIDQNSG